MNTPTLFCFALEIIISRRFIGSIIIIIYNIRFLLSNPYNFPSCAIIVMNAEPSLFSISTKISRIQFN